MNIERNKKIPDVFYPASFFCLLKKKQVSNVTSRYQTHRHRSFRKTSLRDFSVIFLIMYFQSLILQQLYDELRLSSLRKWSFKLTNIMCLIRSSVQVGSKHNLSFQLTTGQILSLEITSHGGPLEGEGLRLSIRLGIMALNDGLTS